MDPNFTTDVKVALARIEERQVSSSKEITSLKESVTLQFNSFKTDYDHKLAQVKMAQQAFMPAKEIDQKVELIKQHCDANREALSDRVVKIEENTKFWSRWIVGLIPMAVLGMLGVIWSFVSKAL